MLRVLGSENWDALLRRVVGFAEREVKRLRFRGAKGGIMPDGYEATSVAAEAVLELFRGSGSLELPYGSNDLEKTLRRLVHRRVDRLHRRRENILVRNGEDLAPLAADDGEELSVINAVPDLGARPDEQAIANEGTAMATRFQVEALACLSPDGEAQCVFDCLCAGVEKRSEISARLGLDAPAVKNARKRMRRALKVFLANGFETINGSK